MRTQNVRLAEEDLQGILGFEDHGAGPPTAEVPAAEKLEIAELGRAAIAPARCARIAQQIEVMPYEPHDTGAQETIEKVRAYEIVCRSVFCLSHVVKESRGPHLAVVALASRELEDLKGMKERVSLRMVARRLRHAIQRNEKVA